MLKDIAVIADELVALQLASEPLDAALLGLPAGERALADLRQSTIDETIASLRSIAARAETIAARPPDDLDELDALTLDLIRFGGVSIAERLAVPLLKFSVSSLFVAPFASVLSTMPQLSLDTEARRAEQLARLRALPDFLAQAGTQHRDGLRTGLTPVARSVQAAIDQLDIVLGTADLAALRRVVGDDDAFEAEQDRLIEHEVAPALRTYRAVLADEMLPAGRDDDHPGLSWLAGGDEMYRATIRYSTSTNRSAEELHALGLRIIDQLNREFAEVGQRIWGTSDVAAIHERLRTDPALRYDSSEEIMETAISTVHRAEAAAPAWFGVIPDSACVVEAVPEAMAANSPAAYYYPGALDGSRSGTYFILTTEPTKRFRHLAEAVAYHEAVPGHHFQLTIAQQSGGHLVHQLLWDVTTAEGWGLYAERLADEMGLYSNDVARLGLFSTDAWRASRLVLDTGLHAMGWTRAQAIEWMGRHAPISEVEIIAEVDRYIAMPGQALSYMVGRIEIERLRALSTETLGERFNVRDFHDMILRCGPVPPPALSAAVQRWLNASH